MRATERRGRARVRRAAVIRVGSLGRPRREPVTRQVTRGAAEVPSAAEVHAAAFQTAAFQTAEPSLASLEVLRRRAARAGVPVRVVLEEGWILRVPPGWGPRVRGWLEEDRVELDPGPSIVIEESPWVFLPVDVTSEPWPRAESWTHAQRLLGVVASSASAFAPSDMADLVARLQGGDEESGRRPMAPERATLLAWDVACAAIAWERNRGAFWMARHAAGHATERSAREWLRRAAAWGVRIGEPSVARSVACAREEAGMVRLGLDELGPRVAEIAESVVLEREQNGPFRSWTDFARRSLRAHVRVRTLLSLALRGALADVPRSASVADESARAASPRPSLTPLVFPGTVRRAACGLSCLSP